MLEYKFGAKKSWIEYFDGLMNPNHNRFQLQPIESYNPREVDSTRDMHEVWTESDCLFVRMSYFNINLTRRFGNDYTLVKDLIKKVKTIAENIVIYEYKFDPGCYNNNEWKKPWLKIGLEYFLGKEFDYVNSIFLGYATIYFCKFPYDKTSDDYRIAENAIR
jgi:hypothetical protein